MECQSFKIIVTMNPGITDVIVSPMWQMLLWIQCDRCLDPVVTDVIAGSGWYRFYC